MKKVAIQGGLGSFHDIAAHQYFEGSDIRLECCIQFEDIFKTMSHDTDVFGMLAIENTIAGSLLHNNELLRLSGTQIIGEHKLRISHCFVCLPDDDWTTITEVNSHPIALMQCREFLSHHSQYKVVECEDTAMSAQNIMENNLHGHAAICSEAAANLFGMKILSKGIETNKHNFTRFLVVADPSLVDKIHPDMATINKSSMVFTLSHTEGSLSQVLSIFSFYHFPDFWYRGFSRVFLRFGNCRRHCFSVLWS